MSAQVRSLEEAQVHIDSLTTRIGELERVMRDHDQRFDTLQTPIWKRVIFWLDGWPWNDLNAEKPKWRPWRRWWTS